MDVVEPETLTSAFRVKEKESGDVGKFLNRILGLDVDHQIMVCDDPRLCQLMFSINGICMMFGNDV